MYTVRDDIGLSHSLHSLGATYLTKPASRAGLGEAVKKSARQNVGVIDGPTRLLIAEDTQSVRDILARQLDNLGVEADFAENGKQALEAYRTGKYGIMFTDLHMPEMDGYEVAKSIRKEEDGTDKHFPLIVLTADIQLAQRDVYMRHGFDECLLKPVSLGQLRGLLMRWRLLEETHEIPEEIEEKTETPTSTPSGDGKPPAIDKECIVGQLGALDDSAIEMMGMFKDMTAPIIEEIKSSLHDGDYTRLTEAGHSLKGGARSACCNVLGDLAAKLQKDASQMENCNELVTEILDEFERVKAEIDNLKA